ncbi:MAG: hypothetical protein A3A43_01680 [Candidatus Liptonbacteria bacterium RIFCSPLOWO2_01_FULL_56_20]|uniref:DNA recombination protein RmuC n=1 Tax=Candidatus Liptonbacteria bacterium RIFCSPLOWO2_01_FULL_56_20 TaxID=1798652 RepID=A0A1G2CMC2_9BACT|nr:MAG: hypothetical protein A3A43_01680 [Candidatus Liptonbacteria bacterium RIFCSPLOWO2_01_FULL_56_20]
MIELVLSLIFVAVAVGAYFLWRLFEGRRPKEGDQSLIMLQNQISELTRTLDMKLGESTKAIQAQFGHSTRIIENVTERLAKLDETNRQVVNFADQLKNLQDILKNPKQRGILGEYYLETVLKNVLPPGSYQMQYPFKSGDIVDAVIFYQERVIPVDSKFSLENYNRLLEAKTDTDRKRFEDLLRTDLKNRIDETAKYIRPAEGTIEFAFMFIPSEALYYDLLVNKVGAVNARDLVEYAAGEKRVFIVSPTSFLAYLQTVIQGLRQVEINKSAEQIRKNIGELARHLGNYDAFLEKLGTHLGTSVNMYNKAYKEFGKIDKDVLRITGKPIGIEPVALDAPQQGEDTES